MNHNDEIVLDWAELLLSEKRQVWPKLSDLQNYGRLSGMARRRKDRVELTPGTLYQVRSALEGSIVRSLLKRFETSPKAALDRAFAGEVFGNSSKQGTSFRLALTSCQPTRLCRDRCYSHDGQDAAPNAIIRGALNTFLAKIFEKEGYASDFIMHGFTDRMYPHVIRAVRHAVQERKAAGFKRQARIRFSHVGDIAAYPKFANWLAAFCIREAELSFHEPLVCVTYTRRKGANKLNPDLWRILFSLDDSSRNRQTWAPPGAKLAWAAFDGLAEASCDVNFAEHHSLVRLPIYHLRGRTAFVCPSTKIGGIHGCDPNRCDHCFRKKEG